MSQAAQQQLRENELNGRALELLARREHSRRELFNKLSKVSSDESLLETLLDKLESRDLLSDRRYCDAYIRYRSGRGIGPQRIAQELALKGVSRSLVLECLEEQSVDWFELAKDVWRKKFRGLLPETPSERAKQQRFLQYRGFEYDHIDNCISED